MRRRLVSTSLVLGAVIASAGFCRLRADVHEPTLADNIADALHVERFDVRGFQALVRELNQQGVDAVATNRLGRGDSQTIDVRYGNAHVTNVETIGTCIARGSCTADNACRIDVTNTGKAAARCALVLTLAQ